MGLLRMDTNITKMATLISLTWIYAFTSVTGLHVLLDRVMYDSVQQVYSDLNLEIEENAQVQDYLERLSPIIHLPSTVMTLQNTSTNVYILDTCGVFESTVRNHLAESTLRQGPILTTITALWDLTMPTPLQEVSDTEVFKVCCTTHSSTPDRNIQTNHVRLIGNNCVGYNITLATNTSHTKTVEEITIDKCGGSTLRSFMGEESLLLHPKVISLGNVPITELNVEDFVKSPELEIIEISDTPVSHMDNGLLCNNLNVTMFMFLNSRGHFKVFPHQIFNCTVDLKIEYFHLEDHDIAYLPSHAFAMTAGKLKILILTNVGLEIIHSNSFMGLLSLESIDIRKNKLLQMPGVVMPPSGKLHIFEYTHYSMKDRPILNVTAMEVSGQNHLQKFVWANSSLSTIAGNFCSNLSDSSLEMIILSNNGFVALPNNIFSGCSSLLYLDVSFNRLEYIPGALFFEGVSQLMTITLEGNRLNDTTPWYEVLMPLNQLKYLNLAKNMLTSWTQGLSSLWQLEMIDLSHNSITLISHVAFRNMTMLEFLSLEGNNLQTLTPELLELVLQIPLLHLRNNQLSVMNVSTTTIKSDPIVIDVSQNYLSELQIPTRTECMDSCGYVYLFADDNELTSFIFQCSNFQQYSTVSLTNNWLTDFISIFPDVFTEQCSIDTLNVSGNYFIGWGIDPKVLYKLAIYMDYGVYQTHTIKVLDMTYCSIEVIDGSAFSLFTLQFIDLRHNFIHAVLQIVEGFEFLDSLDIRFNPITCDCFATWVKNDLENQNLISNKIIATHCLENLWHTSVEIQLLPSSLFLCNWPCSQELEQICDAEVRCFRRNSSLDAVICSSDKRKREISSEFIHVAAELYIYGFNLHTLQLPYTEPSGLTRLNLTSCDISVIPKATFINTPRLELLVLVHNAITTFTSETFHSLVWLTYLDLSHNKLMSFDAELFLPLRLLETLYLHHNELTKFNLNTLQALQTISNLSLHNNPWPCDCNDTFRYWIVENQNHLQAPENNTCYGTNIPVMFSNASCTVHKEIRIVEPRSKAPVLIPSVLSSVLAVILVVCILIYKYRFTLAVLTYIYMPRCSKQSEEEESARGVYAIYDDQSRVARLWIKDSLIPFIEPACPVICYDRDFIIGEDMAVNIEHAVKVTNCAVVLLSSEFLQNSWSCCMFQAAFSEMSACKRSYKIILILTPDVTVKSLISDADCPQDLRILLKTQAKVDMSKKLFSETLLYLLPDSCKSQQQIMAVRGTFRKWLSRITERCRRSTAYQDVEMVPTVEADLEL